VFPSLRYSTALILYLLSYAIALFYHNVRLFVSLMSIVLLLTLPFINKSMHPKNEKDMVLIDISTLHEMDFTDNKAKSTKTPADKLENSMLISFAIGFMGIIVIVGHFINNGFNLNLDIVNFSLLFFSIILHGTPAKFLNAISATIKGATGIIVQFPFYAGIMGMMAGANAYGTSLATLMTNFFIDISTYRTLPLFTFISAGILNIFVPSGGGQWAIQAPIAMPAAVALGADTSRVAMAIAWGDVWTGMIQPFWALPVLAIAGLNAKDIMGFCVVHLFYVAIVVGIGLTIL